MCWCRGCLRRSNRPLLKARRSARDPRRADRAALSPLRRSRRGRGQRRGIAGSDGDPGDRGVGRDARARCCRPKCRARKRWNTIERLRVDLGERGYDILVGPQLIERAGREMLPLMRRRHAVIVSDENVAGHYLAPLRDSLVRGRDRPSRRASAARRGNQGPRSFRQAGRGHSGDRHRARRRCWWRWAAGLSAT